MPDAPTAGRSAADVLRRPISVCIAAVVCALVLYAPALEHDFVYDDVGIVVTDKRLQRADFVLEALTAPWWSVGSAKMESRPLTTFTLWAQVQLHGVGSAGPFHAVNIALYAVLCVQVVMLTWRLTGHAAATWAVGLIFAAHPLHVEVVSPVVGRAETLWAIFSVLAVSLYLRWHDRVGWGRAAALAGCVLLSGLAKEQGYLTAVILGAFYLAERRAAAAPVLRPLPWKLIVCLVAVAALAFIQRTIVQNSPLRGGLDPLDNPLTEATTAERFVTPFKLIGKATELLVLPTNQSPDYSPRVLMPTSDITDPLALLGLAVVMAWGAAAAWAWLRRRSALAALLACAVVWAIPSNTLLIIGTIFGERLLLGLTIWAPLAVAMLLPWDAQPRRVARAVGAAGAVATIVYAGLTIFYLPVWKDNATQGVAVLSRQPLSGRFHGYVAVDLVTLGAENPQARDELFRQAEKHARLALEYWPRQTQPYQTLGIIALHRGDRELARRYLSLARHNSTRLDDLDRILLQLEGGTVEELQQRRTQLQRRLADQPDDAAAMRELADVYFKLKQPREAVDLYRKLVTPDTTDTALLDRYIEAALLDKSFEDALAAYRIWIGLEPGNWSLMTDAAILGNAVGADLSLVKQWIDRATQISPGAPEPYAALGQWHERQGQTAAAAAAYRKAIERSDPRDPKHAQFKLMLDRVINR